MSAYILTGAPGAGKTAVLRLLETLGYPGDRSQADQLPGLAHLRADP
jgi:predicted ATPase